MRNYEMKMGVGTRVVFTIFMLLVLAICVCIILAAFGVFQTAQVDALAGGFSANRYIWAGVAAVLFVVGVCLLFFGKKKGGENKDTSVLLAMTADGSVSVTIPAIEELASRYLNEIYGILTQKIKVTVISDRNVRIDLYLAVKPDVQMPDMTETVTQGIRDYIEKYSGICAGYVGIKVLPMRAQHPVR